MPGERVEFDFTASGNVNPHDNEEDGHFKSSFARSIAVQQLQQQRHYQQSQQQQHHHQPRSLDLRQLQLAGGVVLTSFQTAGNAGYLTEGSSCMGGERKRELGPGDVSELGAEVVKLRKAISSSTDDTRRYSCSSLNGSGSSRRTSLCSSRITEIPDVENVLLQSQIDTLQWQLKQTLESRRMYRNVMKQVVTYLDRAHKSLQLLGKKMNSPNSESNVSRSRSEHQMNSTINSSVNGHSVNGISDGSATLPAQSDCGDYESFTEYSWRKASRKPDLAPDEVPPEKLSQEAFRLLRTVQSLLNTREPELSNTSPPAPSDPLTTTNQSTTIISPNSSNSPNSPNIHNLSCPNPATTDMDFLLQLAREFPQSPNSVVAEVPRPVPPNRTTSFSLSPKLLLPEKEVRISTAFNRKLSLQLNGECNLGGLLQQQQRNSGGSLLRETLHKATDSPRNSIAESDCCLLSSTTIEDNKDKQHRRRCGSISSMCSNKFKFETPEKSNSPPVSTVSSVEDESGFSSMNSFHHDVGLPPATTTTTLANPNHSSLLDSSNGMDAKTALLKSMLHDGGHNNNKSCYVEGGLAKDRIEEEFNELWQRKQTGVVHKRWNSSPVDVVLAANGEKQSLKVLWV